MRSTVNTCKILLLILLEDTGKLGRARGSVCYLSVLGHKSWSTNSGCESNQKPSPESSLCTRHTEALGVGRAARGWREVRLVKGRAGQESRVEAM